MPTVLDSILDKEFSTSKTGGTLNDILNREFGGSEETDIDKPQGLHALSAFGGAFKQSMADKPAHVVSGMTAFTPGESRGLDDFLRNTSDRLSAMRDPEKRKQTDKYLQGHLWPSRSDTPWHDLDVNLIPNAVNTWAAQIGDQIPIMIMTQLGRLAGKIAGAPIGAGAGVAEAAVTGGPDPTDVVAAPATALFVKKAIEHVGGAAPMVLLETGGFLESAKGYKIDKDIAEKYARIYGPSAGAIEYVQQLWNIKALKGLTEPAKKKLLGALLLKIGGNAFEGLEEVSQGGLERKLLGNAIEEMQERYPDYKVEKPDVFSKKESGREFAIGFGIGTASTIVGDAISGNGGGGDAKTKTAAFLSPEGVDALVTAKPDLAAKIAEKEKPTRADVAELGVRMNSDQRAELSAMLKERLSRPDESDNVSMTQKKSPEVQKDEATVSSLAERLRQKEQDIEDHRDGDDGGAGVVDTSKGVPPTQPGMFDGPMQKNRGLKQDQHVQDTPPPGDKGIKEEEEVDFERDEDGNLIDYSEPKPQAGGEDATPQIAPQGVRTDLMDSLVEEAKKQPTAMHSITLPEDITNNEKRYLVEKGLSLSTDRARKPIASYPADRRANDLREKVTKISGPKPATPKVADATPDVASEKISGPKKKGTWRQEFKTADPYRKGDILERVIDVSNSPEELSDVFNHVVKRMPNEKRIMYALTKNRATPKDVKQKAQKRYDQLTAPSQRPMKIDRKGADFDVALPNSDKRVSGQWALVEESDIVTSNSKDYDQSMQPRNRDSAASREQVSSMSKNLDPSQLQDSAVADTGAPIIDQYGQVVSGNGRTEAIRGAYRQGSGEGYKSAISKAAEAKGLSTEGMDRPVLVRVMSNTSGLTVPQVAELANRSNILQRSEAEIAEADAKAIIDNDLMGFYAPDESGSVRAVSNKDFLNRFVEVTGADSLRMSDGRYSPATEQRVKRAVLAAILGNSENARKIVTQAIEQAEELGIKRQMEGLMQVGGRLLKLARNKPQFDLSADLAEAINQLMKFKRAMQNGEVKTPEDWTGQMVMFEEGMSPAEKMVFEDISAMKSMKDMIEYINAYLSVAERIEPGPSLFGEDVTPQTPLEILETFRNERKKSEDNAKKTLYDSRSGEDSGRSEVNTEGEGSGSGVTDDKAQSEEAPKTPTKKRHFTKEGLEAAKKRQKDKSKGPRDKRGGFVFIPDAQDWKDMIYIGGYYLESGVHNFADWSKKVIEQLGDGVKPHLDELWRKTQKEYRKVSDPEPKKYDTELPDDKTPIPSPEGAIVKSESTVLEQLRSDLAEIAEIDPTYEQMSIAEDAEKATNLVNNDIDTARNVVFGYAKPPAGITDTAIRLAYVQKMIAEKNWDEAASAAVTVKLTNIRKGQEIAANRGAVNVNSPLHFIDRVIGARMAAATKKDGKKESTSKKATKRVKQEAANAKRKMTAEQMKINEAQAVLDSLICK